MFFSEVCRRYRRSEPASLTALRAFVMILLLACISGYITVLVLDISNDIKIVRTSHFRASHLPMPDLVVRFKIPFNISCSFSYNDGNQDSIQDSKCNQYIRPPSYSNQDKTYTVIFDTSNDILIADSRADEKGILGVTFLLSTKNESYDTSFNTAAMALYAFDPEFKLYNVAEDGTPNIDNSDFGDTLLTQNLHFITYHQAYILGFTRNIKEPAKSNVLDAFGIPSKHDKTQPFLTSTIETSSFPNGENSTQFARLFVFPKTFMVKVETERRLYTALNGLSLLGGAFFLSTSLYLILFGSDAFRPWGLVQLYCCCFSYKTKMYLEKKFTVLPLYDSSHFYSNSEHSIPLTMAQTVQILKQRQEALEVFLREYVVDASQLQSLRNNAASSTNSTHSSGVVVDDGDRGNNNDLGPAPISTAAQTYPPSNSSNSTPPSPERNVMRNSQVTQLQFPTYPSHSQSASYSSDFEPYETHVS